MYKTHGFSYHPLYKVWNDMKNRCLDCRNPSFYLYGGRGIRVCLRWLSFINFASDMSPSWKKG